MQNSSGSYFCKRTGELTLHENRKRYVFKSFCFALQYNRPTKSVPFTWKWLSLFYQLTSCRSSHPDLFLTKAILKIYSKFTVEHPCQSVISTKLPCLWILRNFQEHLFYRTPPVAASEYYKLHVLTETHKVRLFKTCVVFPFSDSKSLFFYSTKSIDSLTLICRNFAVT